MLKVTLKGLLASRARLVLTAAAVMIGVALVAGTLILTDAVGRSVRHLTAGAHAGIDVAVRNADDAKAGPPQAIGPHLVAAIRAVPGTEAVAGVVAGEKLEMLGRDGRHDLATGGRSTWWRAGQMPRHWPAATRCGRVARPPPARSCWTRPPPAGGAGGWVTRWGSSAPTAVCTASGWSA